MKAEVKELWVKALRSGKYTQTTGQLRDDFGFCCLGVLCEAAIAEGVPVSVSPRNGGECRYDGICATLPDQVSEWAKLDRQAEDYLVQLNDGCKYPFSVIADWIEKEL